jgi:hypothetical protein
MHYVDCYLLDSIYWLMETDFADQLSDDEFAAAVQDRAALLAGIPYPA